MKIQITDWCLGWGGGRQHATQDPPIGTTLLLLIVSAFGLAAAGNVYIIANKNTIISHTNIVLYVIYVIYGDTVFPCKLPIQSSTTT